ncbi:GNAT family N-acetyltransferase [Telmatospirillum sp. J64-1]|uniref:GNAT family N-acetyltransferase n=1 Tax=Telmatospirillum sp. J64-1 TaxID=2502183 RepID=UPI00115CFFAC|nr:GNAT family N-acyltransferase [Telmatospirillum sp. J64-1]
MTSVLRSGDLEVRLAADRSEIEAAQTLRYSVFYDEMGAHPTPEMAALGRDFDEFDLLCDHLLVIDTSMGRGAEGVVGTYRLMQRSQAECFGRFYTASEFDITRILRQEGRLLELGRSCVHRAYRTKLTMQMLWRGIAAYVNQHKIDLMFGCASLPGTDPQALALPLSYLRYHHLAPEDFRPAALPGLYTDMALLPPEEVDPKRALVALPPLVKGYLRLGGFIGDGAVIDRQFNTIDVCVIVKTDLVTDKYQKHYERTARDPQAAQDF